MTETREARIKTILSDNEMDTFKKLKEIAEITGTNLHAVSLYTKKKYGLGRYLTLRNWMKDEPKQFVMFRFSVRVMLNTAKKLDKQYKEDQL